MSTAIFALLMPAIVVVQQFVIAALVHVCALVFGAGQHGFQATFRVICYSLGSTAVLNLVPAFGSLAGLIWGLVAAIIGMTRAHETTGGRAAGAVLTPMALCCVGTTGLIGIAVVAAMGLGG